MTPVPITERFLSDAGGWQALKQARAIHQMGRVQDATYEPPELRGRVKEGESEFKSGLTILSASNVENLCTCRESRQRGTICAHSLAVGLEIIKPLAAATPPRPSSTASTAGASSSLPAAIPTGPPPKFHLALEGSLNHLTARLSAVRHDYKTTLASTGAGSRHPAETAALDRLNKAGFTGPDQSGQLILKTEPRILAFFAAELPRLQKEWTVEIGERFDHVTRDIERISPKLEIRASGENWFDLSLDLATPSGERFAASEIQRLLQSGQSSTRLKNRKIAVFDPGLLDEFQQALMDCNPQQSQPGQYRIAKAHAGYLDAVTAEQGTPGYR